MECSCNISIGDFDGPEAFKHEIRKARKDHKCCECRELIIKESQYHYFSRIWDGEPRSYKFCNDCMSIANQFFSEGWGFTQLLADLDEYINGINGDIPSVCISALTPKARERVCDMIQEYWNETEKEKI